ncbi:MAG: Nif3-like dinuclear metal center hexameric protein [Lachnospiraceae bacterium]|jgi:dinuclear metal center YbgI/SA1388 family protein|nr:Nif3-like dinuclear metal center hexameric protein [Lachnospiraceae bacterium]
MKCKDITDILDELSPRKYACSWDNVGLLAGRKNKKVSKVMVALDASYEVVNEAVTQGVDMLITHHPMIFSPLKQINEDGITSDKIMTLLENHIAYYAMHTNFDTVGGMGSLAAGDKYLNLKDIKPLIFESDEVEGMGRGGKLPKPMTASEACEYVKKVFSLDFVMLYQGKNDADKVYEKIAVLPGSGKSELEEIKALGYELYLTGDFSHHPGLDAIDEGMAVIDATHYGLEHIFISYIANYLKEKCNDELEVVELDTGCPLRII